ncbi:MAG: hypothetical protein ACTSYA_03415 [Candidatus Kariarchaeaceae archaeon]
MVDIMVLIRGHQAHFIYWHLHRRGDKQIEIAKKYNVSKQAVSKALKIQNHKTLVILLQMAYSLGVLTEWQDEKRGILVGIVPQLQDRICIIIVDVNNKVKVIYGGRSDELNHVLEKKYQLDLIRCLDDCLNQPIEQNLPFLDIINQLVLQRR